MMSDIKSLQQIARWKIYSPQKFWFYFDFNLAVCISEQTKYSDIFVLQHKNMEKRVLTTKTKYSSGAPFTNMV